MGRRTLCRRGSRRALCGRNAIPSLSATCQADRVTGWEWERRRREAHVRDRVGVVLAHLLPIRHIVRQKQRTPIECRRQPRNNRIRLRILARSERTRVAPENIRRGRFLEHAARAEIEFITLEIHLTAHITEGSLRVDRQGLRGIVAVDLVHVGLPVGLEPGRVQQDTRVRAEDAEELAGVAAAARVDYEGAPAPSVLLGLGYEGVGDGLEAVGWHA